ncbi:MAG TPA: WD40 repeat domain-containing protein, partial [Planctomycetaceae bacterium]|nr:WD40 repeat domain-containing protein [Planctomycetaceae bacterium]
MAFFGGERAPRELVGVIGDARLTHWAPIRTLAVSSRGKLLATGSTDHTVALWDLSTGRLVHRLEHDGPVESVAFNADGTLLATGCTVMAPELGGPLGCIVTLWNVESATVLRTIGELDSGTKLAFSPDGRRLAAGGMGTLKVWDVETSRELHAIDAHMSEDRMSRHGVSSLAFSPDGTIIASASHEGSGLRSPPGVVKLWDAGTGVLRQTLKGQAARCESVAFSPDGRTLATGGGGGSVVLWNALSGN